MLGLIPIATALIPELAKWAWGDKGGAVAEAASSVIRAVTGTDDATAAEAAINADPKLAAEVRMRLAQIVKEQEDARHQAQLESIRMELANTQGARQQTMELAKAGSVMHMFPGILSLLILSAFAFLSYVVVTKGLPAESREQANIMLGTLGTLAGMVCNYWLGSSLGSMLKNPGFLKGDKNTP